MEVRTYSVIHWPIIEFYFRIWSDRMDPEQFEGISLDMQVLHKSMKNIIEMVFATSPLLALSTSGWHSKSFQGTYLLKVGDVFVFFLRPLSNLKGFYCPG